MSFDALRTMVAGFLTDECTVATPGAGPVFNPETGTTSDALGGNVYEGPCRVIAGGGRSLEVGGAHVPFGAFDVRLPWDTTGIEVGQVLTVTSSADPALVDREMHVSEVHVATDNAYRRVLCDMPTPVAEFEEVT